MITIITVLSIIGFCQGDQIYPSKSTTETQLENNGWVDCSSQEEILPLNCQGDDLLWLECYVVPQNGLCSKQNININTQDTVNYAFTFYKTQLQTCDIEINGQSMSENLNTVDDLSRAIFTFNGSSAKIKIKNSGAQFTGLTISKDCNPNCQKCDKSFCSQCLSDSFYYYDYRCSKLDCGQQIQNLNSNSLINSQGQYIDGILKLEFEFSVDLGDCLIPKAYYTYKIENSQIKLILPENQVYLKSNSPNTLITELPLEQIIENCQLINTTSSFVYQCYIGIAITSELFTQYLVITISQLAIEKSTETTTSYIQAMNVPSDENITVGPVFLVSETLSVDLDTTLKQIKVLQTISDPDFSNFRISYYQAYLLQQNNTIMLDLQNEIQSKVNTTFVFSWSNPLFNPSDVFQLIITSYAKPALNNQRRRLDVPLKRDNLQVNYNAQNVYVYKNDEAVFNPDIKEGSLVGILVGGAAVVTIIIIIAFNKYQSKGQENQL